MNRQQRDPVRIVEGDDEADALRVDLGRAIEHDVGYDVAAGAARFDAAIADGGATAAEMGTGSGTAVSGKAIAVIVGALTIAGAIAVGMPGDDAPRPGATTPIADVARPPASIVDEPARADTPSVPVTPPASAPVEPEAAAEDPRQAAATAPDKRPRAIVPDPPASTAHADTPPPIEPDPVLVDDAVRREMQATQRAREALTSDPERALEHVATADAEFPDGMFGEQRRGIAVLALLALGREDEARRHADRYLDAHPRGTYAAKIRARLAEQKP